MIDPDGVILSIARKDGTIATATIDLSKRYMDGDAKYGEMHSRRMKEIRLDVHSPLPGLEK